MVKLIFSVLLVGAIVGGAYVLLNYDADWKTSEDGDLESVTFKPKDGSGGGPSGGNDAQRRLRIATFNLSGLEQRTLENEKVATILAHVITQFDVLAVQNIRAENRGVLVRLVDRLNAKDRRYNFATGTLDPSDSAGPYSAFLFDSDRVRIDRMKVYTVDDPSGRLQHLPLVGQFRATGPDPAEAFTFKLVNLHIDPVQAAVELALLNDIYMAVRKEGGLEDDIIMLGDFGRHEASLEEFGRLNGVVSLISNAPTTLNGTLPVDNILIDRQATTEFTGLADVFDLMKNYELTMRETVQVSEHMPVWAEFSSYEGGQEGHVAGQDGRTTR